ncbi:YheU family protein [Marinimicrobium locisalis]|uniref:YheU family protein n=1 Tax=Marinimicrobium locisalis TaxID=546022 RepID=UPI003221E51F
MIIPHEQLSDSALRGLMEEFITREGTDYGWEETSLERKVEQVRRQIEQGDVVIVFDPATESVTLLTQREARDLDND